MNPVRKGLYPAILFGAILASVVQAQAAAVEFSYLWHMHQPVYWPDTSLTNPNSCQYAMESLNLKNASAREIKLTSASNPASKTTELHTHVNEGGVMKMRPVPFIAIPAGGEAVLKPGSLHVMLIDLLRPLTEGESVAITLNFDDGTTLVVDAPVKRIEAPMPGHAPKKP